MWFPLQSLLLLHYLIRNGSERVVTNAREHVYDMKPLEEYTCRDDHGRDQGVNGECRICGVMRKWVLVRWLYYIPPCLVGTGDVGSYVQCSKV